MVDPTISVVMVSCNRGELAVRAVRSVLDQSMTDVEVVVVDQSTDDTPRRLGTIHDARLTVLLPPVDLGMPVARNVGIEAARGAWIGFLDDDDELLPTWAARLRDRFADDVGKVSCGWQRVDGAGRPGRSRLPIEEPVGPWGDGCFIASAFVIRRSVLVACGGMLPGLPSSHHVELALRAAPALRSAGWRSEQVNEVLTHITERDDGDAPMGGNARQLYEGCRWVLVRHAAALQTVPEFRSRSQAMVAVSAAHVGEWSDARRFAWRAARSWPRDPQHWLRLAGMCLPPLATRRWPRLSVGDDERHRARGLRRVPELVARLGVSDDLLFLPVGFCSELRDGRPTDLGQQLQAAANPYEVLARVRSAGGGDVQLPVRSRGGDGAGRSWTPDEFRLLAAAAGLDAVRTLTWRPGRRRRQMRFRLRSR